MTAVLHRFPTPPALDARLAEARRVQIVEAARSILRSASQHDDAILTEACVTLQTWGDGLDHLEADAMMLAMRLRASRRLARPQPSIRADDVALALSALFVVGMLGAVFAKAAGWW